MFGINNVFAAFSRISMNIIPLPVDLPKVPTKSFVTSSGESKKEEGAVGSVGSNNANVISQESSNENEEEIPTNARVEIEDNSCLVNNNRETRQYWCKQQPQNLSPNDIN